MLVMDELNEDIQEMIPWLIPFAGDTILLDELQEEMNAKHEFWEAL